MAQKTVVNYNFGLSAIYNKRLQVSRILPICLKKPLCFYLQSPIQPFCCIGFL